MWRYTEGMKNDLIQKLNSFTSLFDLQQAFPTEKSCVKYLELIRWNGKVVSPFDETSKVYNAKTINITVKIPIDILTLEQDLYLKLLISN